jgi:hypothetical protein
MLLRAWQKRDAAETLWPRGSPAEAIRVACDGFALAAEAIERLAEARGDADGAARLLAVAKARAAQLAEPHLDAEVSAAHGEALRTLLDEMLALDRYTSGVVAGPRVIAAARTRRRFWAVILAVMVLAACFVALHAAHSLRATASGTYSASFPVTNAIDGRADTEWLMPDKAPTGWLELALGGSRKVSTVRILNGHNPPHNERALHEFRLTCFSGARIVKVVPGNLPFNDAPQWTSFDFGGVSCDRVRLDVTSVWNNGGALAEIDVP